MSPPIGSSAGKPSSSSRTVPRIAVGFSRVAIRTCTWNSAKGGLTASFARCASLLAATRKEYRLALSAVYGFLVAFLRTDVFTLQVGEVHTCCDLAGWELALDDAERFVSQGRAKAARLDQPSDDIVRLTGRRCTEFKFSQGAAHSCDIYDKTMEVKAHQKEWFHAVWKANGWDGKARVMRAEFRYKRACLNEMGIDEPYDMLDRLPNMWAYSTKKWLRHTEPDSDSNQTRWPTTAWWQTVQGVTFERADALPGVRVKQRQFHERKMLSTILGYVESWVAWKAAEGGLGVGFDLYDTLVGVFDQADDHYNFHQTTFREAVTQKRRKIGFTD